MEGQDRRSSFSKEDLIQSGAGKLFGEGTPRLPNGNMLLSLKSNGFTWTDGEAPIGNGSIACFGSSVVSAEGEQLSGAGTCRVLDDESDVWTIWYT